MLAVDDCLTDFVDSVPYQDSPMRPVPSKLETQWFVKTSFASRITLR